MQGRDAHIKKKMERGKMKEKKREGKGQEGAQKLRAMYGDITHPA